MIIEGIFKSLVFEWMLVRESLGEVATGQGLLFPAPEIARSPASRVHNLSAEAGWSRCPAGYAIYVRSVPFLPGARVVLFGLKVRPYCVTQGRATERSVWLESAEVESYIAGVIETAQSILVSFSEVMNASIHEIRSINRDITAAAQNVMDHAEGMMLDRELVGGQAHSVRSLSEILATRADFLEYLSSTGRRSIPHSRIRPYAKFDKVRRSLEARARTRNITVAMSGSSFEEIVALDVFEVIPYLIIQNAIKYSPDGEEVTILVEDEELHVKMKVENYGPMLDDDELIKLFDLGYRGRVAARVVGAGWGLGMAFLRDLVELHHHGTLSFAQERSVRYVDTFPYAKVAVEVRFPKAAEGNRSTFRRRL